MSKLGASVSSAARNGIGSLFAAGMPFVSCIDQNLINEAHADGVIVAFRTQHGSMGEDNPPGFMDIPLDQQYQIGIDYLNSQLSIWQQNAGADYYVVNNEQEPGTLDHAQKLNQFFLGAMGRADALGLHLSICNFATGNPSDDGGLTLEQRWEPMLPAIQYACEHGHVIGLHIHADGLIASGEDAAFRHDRTLRYFASHNLYPKVIITELSNGVEGIEPNLDTWWSNVSQWDLHVMASQWSPQIIGAALYGWTADATLTPAVTIWGEWLIDHPDPVVPPPSVDQWEIDDVMVDGVSIGPQTNFNVAMTADRNVVIVAKKKVIYHTLTVAVTPSEAEAHTIVTPSGGTYPDGLIVEMTVSFQ